MDPYIKMPNVGHQYFDNGKTLYHGVTAREFGVVFNSHLAIKGAFCNLDCSLLMRGFCPGDVSSYTVYVLTQAKIPVLDALDAASAEFFTNSSPIYNVEAVERLKEGNYLEISAIVSPKNN